MDLLTTITDGLKKIGEIFGGTPAREPYNPDIEKRKARRYFCKDSTYFFESKEDYENAKIHDISLKGIRFSLNNEKRRESKGSILLMLDKACFNMPIKIAWVKRGFNGIELGAQFLETSEQKQRLLKLYIQKMRLN
jgi:hypothetical protein